MESADADLGKMEAELRQWGTRLDNLLAMAEVAGTAARIEHRRRLDDLKAKYDAAESRRVDGAVVEAARACAGNRDPAGRRSTGALGI